MSERTLLWSCGGGTQSAAIGSLIIQGKLPKPELAIIVDTEREKSSTWAYYEAFLRPGLEAVGVELERVRKSDFATVDLWSGSDGGACILPCFTSEGGRGKMPAFCSGEWKREVVKRWARSKGVKYCTSMIGISVDEIRRMRAPRCEWFQESYPLIDLRIRRFDCPSIIAAVGWPTPPRSSCWMCPNMGDDEWREMMGKYPQDFTAACQLEREIRQRDEHLWLHRSYKPLDQVDFSQDAKLFDDNGCASGYCYV